MSSLWRFHIFELEMAHPEEDSQLRVEIKQWPLAGEFVEFEYSPKIRLFWRIRVLAKMVILENWPVSIHSPTFTNLFWLDSIHSPTFANLVCSNSPDSPTFANLLCPDSPDSPTFAKGLFWEKCDSPRHIPTSNSPFWWIWGEWPLLSWNKLLTKI